MMLVPTVLLIRHLDPQVAKQAWDSAAGSLGPNPRSFLPPPTQPVCQSHLKHWHFWLPAAVSISPSSIWLLERWIRTVVFCLCWHFGRLQRRLSSLRVQPFPFSGMLSIDVLWDILFFQLPLRVIYVSA